MENTGRLVRAPLPSVRKILFDASLDADIDAELRFICRVDRAHLLMLVERGIVDRAAAASVLATVAELECSGFEPLKQQQAPRGLYLLYEDYLIRQLGPEVGGILQTARSRNDLSATVFRMRLRQPYIDLVRAALGLEASLLIRARWFSRTVMPLYTHFQPAVPVTLGHYFAAVAAALDRDVQAILEASPNLQACPLGAGAGGGTTLPIDAERTAMLLGFDHPVSNSIDAVASRDLVLRIVASAAILGVTVSRLASDLLLWTSGEFGFLDLPDELVGSSSMMPQKRNPFLLEQVAGRSATPLGAFVAAAAAMRSTPFTNSIAVGTEGTKHLWKAIEDMTEASRLVRLVVTRATPNAAAMAARAHKGNVAATAMAETLVAERRMAFRTAHHFVGSLIREFEGHPELVEQQFQRVLDRTNDPPADTFTPDYIVDQARYGGGPSEASTSRSIEKTRCRWAVRMQEYRDLSDRWRRARGLLDKAVRELVASAVE